jgi:hypothetical protein
MTKLHAADIDSEACRGEDKDWPLGATNDTCRQTGLPIMTEQTTETLDFKTGADAQEEAADTGRLDQLAAELYRIGSMMVGEGEDSILVVEAAVENGALAGGGTAADAARRSRRILCAAALGVLRRRDALSLASPDGLEHVATCIGDDELDGGGVSREELEQMISGRDRNRMRSWLEGLSVPIRTVFVLRAVAGFTPSEAAELLVESGGTQAAGWTGEAVRELYRQGMCSLASQVLQASGR